MATTNGSTRKQISEFVPPRTINVQKFAESRASELEALHSIVATRLNNDFRSRRNKRRRTTGHDDRVTKKRRGKRHTVGMVESNNDLASKKHKEKVPRRIRRRLELKVNPKEGYCTSGDGTKRLRTHVWHAKRFKMKKLWGFYLPLCLQGRGKGSRAILKKLKNGALIHDASYFVAVQLKGPEDSLLSILRTVLVPSTSTSSKDLSCSLVSGDIYGSAMLHHVGVPVSQPIAPVTYMWRPFHQKNLDASVGDQDQNTDKYIHSSSIKACSSLREMWVWIHASAFTEGYNALLLASQKQMNETGVSVNCSSLEGQLAKLEVMGSKAFQILQKILHPVTCNLKVNSRQLKKCSNVEAGTESLVNSSIFENEHHFSSQAVISLIVNDPRALPEEEDSVVPEASKGELGDVLEREAKENSTFVGKSGISYKMDLWDVCDGISPPVEDSVLCMEKHQKRMAFFCLGDTNASASNNSTEAGFSRLCPIILVKNNMKGSSLTRLSLILPISWVKAFWISLVSNGAHAIGLTEKRWIACELGFLYFPSDFPETSAYSSYMETEATLSDEKASLRPPSMRPLKVPIPPPWNSIKLSFDKRSTRITDAQPSNGSDHESFDVLDHHGPSVEGHVARTSQTLSFFLNENQDHRLLLFPNVSDWKEVFSNSLKDNDGRIHGPTATLEMSYGLKVCFVRVLIHAYKEGAFEDGALVCAPHLTDISLWTHGSENNGVQISQSAMRSYFKQTVPGKWEIEVPEDPLIMESHRWPIGFVTNGFVRGSKKPVAAALCEATLLARLRKEQWSERSAKQRRKEIYVLVRNLPSTAYRLAHATIVLEQQEDDLEFI